MKFAKSDGKMIQNQSNQNQIPRKIRFHGHVGPQTIVMDEINEDVFFNAGSVAVGASKTVPSKYVVQKKNDGNFYKR